MFQNFENQNKKFSLRHLWDETVYYDASQRSTEEKESIEHCRDSNYKYFIHYVGGLNYTFKQFINRDNAVRIIIFIEILNNLQQPLINILKGEGEGNGASYVEHIGIFFFFVACAGVSIVVWIFNWICWYNKCCCCDFLHNPVNKRLVWWTSFIFLLGILACAIAGTVTSNRFGFALEGSWCAFDRIYYDSLNGQLKDTYPKWTGFDMIMTNLTNLNNFINNKKNFNISKLKFLERKDNFFGAYITEDFVLNYEKEKEDSLSATILSETLFLTSKYGKIIDSLEFLQNIENKLEENIKYINSMKSDFTNLKSDFLQKYYYYAKIGKAFGKIITMIYFCLLIILTAFTGTSMMFYACLKRQGYLSIFMHVFWNIIRFFMFSFFFYGTAFGMCYLALRDAVAFVMYVFGEENLNLNNRGSRLIPLKEGKVFLHYCLINKDNDFKNKLDKNLVDSIEDYFKSYSELKSFLDSFVPHAGGGELIKSQNSIVVNISKNIQDYICNGDSCYDFPEMANRKGGIFGSLDCSFLKSDLAMTYRTIYDLSIEARILCALSCCIAFFGAVFVYLFLLVMHHYDTELFPEHKKAIFTGFDGFGNTKKKSFNDPQHKKRKLRAEVELSSRNEEYSGFQHGNND